MTGFVMIGGGGEACGPEDGCLPATPQDTQASETPVPQTLKGRVAAVAELPLDQQVAGFEELSEELAQRLQSTRG